ncbi:MAG TPA: 4-hydroxythreonine-4-phosphate dehydrogenase PdxA [Polyangiaceae bacterium]|nr:4-hydroxythreonine-4-phosphate dehydrogenase PdxA [Polyangiaceae bacterium]
MTAAVRALVTVGCPCGIGPEVSVVAAARERPGRVVLVGDLGAVVAAARGRGIDQRRIVQVSRAEEGWGFTAPRIAVWQPTPRLAPADRRPGAPTAVSGAAQIAWIDAACDAVSTGEADALVTGPVSKEAIARSGAPGGAAFRGHTEHLQKRLRAREVVMAFWSPRLVTSLATTHVPLGRVPRRLTPSRVASATYWLAWLLSRVLDREPRIAVAALNPHAGEGGLLGREERTSIVPGIEQARARVGASGMRATIEGPVAAETAFRLALARRWDGIVAMYHDQATIPMKLVGFGDAVNVSLGLPIIRTSVDHGTAYDRAGLYDADARGMRAAVRLAARLVLSEPSRAPRQARREAARTSRRRSA